MASSSSSSSSPDEEQQQEPPYTAPLIDIKWTVDCLVDAVKNIDCGYDAAVSYELKEIRKTLETLVKVTIDADEERTTMHKTMVGALNDIRDVLAAGMLAPRTRDRSEVYGELTSERWRGEEILCYSNNSSHQDAQRHPRGCAIVLHIEAAPVEEESKEAHDNAPRGGSSKHGQ